ncbi:MAG: TRAP transporter substrate-binding protein [Rhodospirillales bacterium]
MKILHSVNMIGGLALAVALTAGTVSAEAKPLELKFGHVGAPGSLFDLSAKEFAKRVNEKMKGEAKVLVFGSSQLGKDQELLKKLKLGTVTFSLPSTVMSSVSDEFGVFEMPYIVKDRDHAKKLVKPVIMGKLQKRAKGKGYRIIAVWENGFRHITNNVRPINTPADLKGIKLRTPKGKWRVKMFKEYGANPSPLSFSEVFTALKTGTFDGQENPFAQIHSAKFQEVQKYLSLTNHVYTPAYVLVGAKHWAKLPKKVTQAIEKIAKETSSYVYDTADKLEKDLLAKLKGKMKVNTADREAFVKASKPIYDEFVTRVNGGYGLVNQVEKLGKM